MCVGGGAFKSVCLVVLPLAYNAPSASSDTGRSAIRNVIKYNGQFAFSVSSLISAI